ncbi:MAG TPA: hypothetical protein VL625_02615 [Patescibacteria group bacterium]|nr:hypothetical protein [Patescibacteria group bacterium]
MSYWVFDSWSLGKAIIHKSECAFCEEGTHRQGTRDSNNGNWRGPFSERDEAFVLAKSLTRKIIRGCGTCAP